MAADFAADPRGCVTVPSWHASVRVSPQVPRLPAWQDDLVPAGSVRGGDRHSTRRTTTVIVAVAIAVTWVSAITVLIAHQPDPGAPSPGQLKEDLTAALNRHDVEALSELVDYPPASSGEFAKLDINTLTGRGAHAVTVKLVPDDVAPTSATVSGTRRRQGIRLSGGGDQGRPLDDLVHPAPAPMSRTSPPNAARRAPPSRSAGLRIQAGYRL